MKGIFIYVVVNVTYFWSGERCSVCRRGFLLMCTLFAHNWLAIANYGTPCFIISGKSTAKGINVNGIFIYVVVNVTYFCSGGRCYVFIFDG